MCWLMISHNLLEAYWEIRGLLEGLSYIETGEIPVPPESQVKPTDGEIEWFVRRWKGMTEYGLFV